MVWGEVFKGATVIGLYIARYICFRTYIADLEVPCPYFTGSNWIKGQKMYSLIILIFVDL